MKHGTFASILGRARRARRNEGIALVTSLMWLGALMVTGTGLVSFTTSGTIRVSREQSAAQSLNAADAGVQDASSVAWNDFRTSQRFESLDLQCSGASTTSPRLARTGALPGRGRYFACVTDYEVVDNWNRRLSILSIGWDDRNNNATIDAGESPRALRSQVQLSLERSRVFDYAYFVNNYGWMTGFSSTQLIVNGDMRANGNFDFSGGLPTINGSVYASRNDKLIPPAAGMVNITPTQWANSYYQANAPAYARQAYDPSRMGEMGSDEYEMWRDLIYDRTGSIVRGRPSGAVVADVRGTRTYSGAVLDPTPTKEVTMPDLSDIGHYIATSQNYVDQKSIYIDGTPNPYYGQGAYVEVWDPGTARYVRVTTDGVYNGSAALIGSSTYPIRVHGPVTFTGDVVIKGYVEGQATLYAARNVHIVGNVLYKNAPDFRGTDIHQTDVLNEKKDMLGLAARGSVILGNPKTMSSTALSYMTPPFTKARYDDNGNLIPAFNAKEYDSYGVMRYKSLLGDSYLNSIFEPINNIHAVLYTNFLGGGDIGQSGGGVTFNGSIISKDEAMILFSLPLRMNYDNRLRRRLDTNQPLVDIKLPVAPEFIRLAWTEVPIDSIIEP